MYLERVISRKTLFFNYFFVGLLKVNDKNEDPDPNPDPLVRGMDPQHWSRLKFISVFLFCFAFGTMTSSYSGGADGSSHRRGSLQGQQRVPLQPQVIAPEILRKVNFCFCQ
jgi:hypothetical protein